MKGANENGANQRLMNSNIASKFGDSVATNLNTLSIMLHRYTSLGSTLNTERNPALMVVSERGEAGQ